MRYQKLSEIVVNNVLAFIKPFASKRLSLGIEKLLKPCCKVTVVDAIVICNDDNTYNVTLTLSDSVNFLGLGAFTFLTETEVFGVGTFQNGNTINIPSVDITSDTYNVSGLLLLPTNQSGDMGVFVAIPTFEITLPACS